MRILQTYNRIDGKKFVIVFMMLVGVPFLWGLLPLLILSAPLRLIWNKVKRRKLWRAVSLTALIISLSIGFALSFGMDKEIDGGSQYGFPIVFAKVQPDDSLNFGNDTIFFGLMRGLNLSIITATLMLPLTILSFIEAKRQSNSADN